MTKRIAIIGSGPNLAMEIARKFGRGGWHVVLGARNMDRLDRQARALRDEGIAADARKVDATDGAQIGAFVQGVEEAYGPVDVLNYNAAVIRQAGLMELSSEAFAADLATDVVGAFHALRAALPIMASRGRGTVILSGGGLAIDPWPDYLTLSVGKAGLRALATAVAKDREFADIHIAHVILHVAIDPEAGRKIADLYWELAQEEKGHWRTEVTFPASETD